MQNLLIAASRATPTPLPATPTPAPTGLTEVMKAEGKDAFAAAIDTAKAAWNSLPHVVVRLILALGVLILGLIILKIGKLIIRKAVRRRSLKNPAAVHRADTRRSIITSIFNYIMFFVMATVILRLFGVDVTSILAAAGVVGVAVAFGAQTLVKDILSGLFIWGEGSIAVGDIVTINDLSGAVESISIRTTTIRNYNGNLCTIPNGDIRTLTNMSRSFKRAIVNVPCPYEENQERIVAMVREEMAIAAEEIEGINTVPEVMSIVSFDTHAVILQIAVPCPIGEHWRIERDIRTRVKARFDREGIIMPHYTLPKE